MSKEPQGVLRPNEESFQAVVLAAGQGTRMKSALPKVLHEVGGRPLVTWPVTVALDAGAQGVVVVVGHGREQVEGVLATRFPDRVKTAVQAEQLGTGHAVQCALGALDGYAGSIVILYGDCPLVPEGALTALLAARQGRPMSMLVTSIEDPTGYGRILREGGAVVGIREHRDASDDERRIQEINPGLYAFDGSFLRQSLETLKSDNAAGELYLTDLVALAAAQGGVGDVHWRVDDLLGINDRWELGLAEGRMQHRIAEAHARAGVTIRQPSTVWIGADVEIGRDVTLEPHVVLRGRTVVAEGARVDVGCVLTDAEVEAGAYLKPYTVATESTIGERSQTGPFAHLRPGSELGQECRIGNFVETKKTRLGRGSKANHLAYLGDGVVGEGVNVSAGVIFCNYDGYQKHVTTLEDGAFVGSDCQLIAPVTVGRDAYVATGTTVTLDVPAEALAVGRTRQSNKDGYATRLRAKLKAQKKS